MQPENGREMASQIRYRNPTGSTEEKPMTDTNDDNDEFDHMEPTPMENDPFDTGKIRNPDRIEPICAALEQRWKEAPDLRLGQLVSVLTGQGNTFGVEDTEVMEELGVEIDGDFWTDKED